MYFESRGMAGVPIVICSARSADLLNWKLEEGIRLSSEDGVGAPRYLALPGGGGRIYCWKTEYLPGGGRRSASVVSAATADGLNFSWEPGYRMRDKQGVYDAVGITAGEVVPPAHPGDEWTMFFSAWQDPPAEAVVPLHPSHDKEGEARGQVKDFAAASIASDLAGYRSRIFVSYSRDGLAWGPSRCVVEGSGYDGDEVDAVHAEDMSLVRTDDGRYRMYYAACGPTGEFLITSAISE
jgi:hypothetical protein